MRDDSTASDSVADAAPDALGAALAQVLAPLATLAVARGMTYPALDDAIKLALIDAADRAHADLPPHRRVSRIATATGIHRREVTRLLAQLRAGQGVTAAPARSQASELFAHWRTNRRYCDRRGSPLELPRQGEAPSFESLAQAITRDVHPRSLMDELLRLGLAAHDAERDTVRLIREAFVPAGDQARMFKVLGANVGSHLAAAVDNVLGDGRQHFEQALFARGLGAASIAEARALIQAQWQALMDALVPALETMVARDRDAPAGPRQRLRLGLYSHCHDDAAAAPGAADASTRETT
jgi:hypothetical protein